MTESAVAPSRSSRGDRARILRRSLLYGAIALLICIAAGSEVRRVMDHSHGSAGRLPAKMNYYARAARDYDMVFLGDSRTFCDFHPEILDSVLGTHSFNLGHWTNWFPTQYAQANDLLRTMPSDTVVVWSIGFQNFSFEPIQPAYPIGWRRLPGFLKRGY